GPRAELRKRPVVDDDVCRHLLRTRPRAAPLLQRLDGRGLLERRAVPLREGGRSRAYAELVEEPARLALPRHEQMPLRPRQPDVEQAPLLGDLAAAHRQLALLDTRQEDGLPLEPLRPMQRQQVDAATGALPEALVEEVDEAVDLAGMFLGEPHEPRQVGLPRLLALAELLRHLREEPLPQGKVAHDLGSRPSPTTQRLQQLA